jgi:hypothetical protein
MAGGGHRDLVHRLNSPPGGQLAEVAKRNSTPVAGYAVRSPSKGLAEKKTGSGKVVRCPICLSAYFTAVKNAGRSGMFRFMSGR